MQVKDEYLQCLKDAKGAAENCESIAQQYLQCRMDRSVFLIHSSITDSVELQHRTPYLTVMHVLDMSRNLMAKQDMHELGFGKSKRTEVDQTEATEQERKKTGFVAGLSRKQ